MSFQVAPPICLLGGGRSQLHQVPPHYKPQHQQTSQPWCSLNPLRVHSTHLRGIADRLKFHARIPQREPMFTLLTGVHSNPSESSPGFVSLESCIFQPSAFLIAGAWFLPVSNGRKGLTMAVPLLFVKTLPNLHAAMKFVVWPPLSNSAGAGITGGHASPISNCRQAILIAIGCQEDKDGGYRWKNAFGFLYIAIC